MGFLGMISKNVKTCTYYEAEFAFFWQVVELENELKSISFEKGVKKDGCTKFPENLPMSKCKQNMLFRSVQLFHRQCTVGELKDWTLHRASVVKPP